MATEREQMAHDLGERRHGVTMRAIIRRNLNRGGVSAREIELYRDGIEFRLTLELPDSERRAWRELAAELEAMGWG
jgi:hypothetical protein